MTANVKVLCAVWDLMHYTFNLAPMLIKGTNTGFTTSAHIAQNTCYRLAGFSALKFNWNTKESFLKMRSEGKKAKELIDKHRKWVNQIEGSYSETEYAKKAALITIDEILEVESKKMINGDVNEYDYWEKVKTAINEK